MFRDQIEFKQVELKEAQSLIKNLELKNKALTEEMKMWWVFWCGRAGVMVAIIVGCCFVLAIL